MDAPLDPTPLPGEHVTAGGVPLYRVAHGRGEPVLLLHGIPTSSYLWRNVQRGLGETCTTIAPDLLGLGRSGRPREHSWRLVDQAELLATLLDQLGIERVVLVAHDIGGAVAHHFTARYPQRVRAQILMNAATFAESWPVPLVRAMRAPLLGDVMSLAPSTPLLRRELRRGLAHPERMAGEVFAHYAAPLAGLGGRRAFTRFIRGMDPAACERDFRAMIDADLPRLVLWGTDDIFQPLRFGERLHEAWAGSTLVPVADAGHFLQEDQPARVAEEIRRFVTGLL